MVKDALSCQQYAVSAMDKEKSIGQGEGEIQ